MYEDFFHLNSRPFAAVPDINCYVPISSTEVARQTIVRCLERAEGVAIVIGPPGTGKSMLCQILAQQLAAQFEIVYLRGCSVTSRRSLYQSILRVLGLPYRLDEGELRLSLADFIELGISQTQGLAILVDEAQSLPNNLLEELRLLSNLSRGNQAWVRVVLAGGSELEERFANPKLESFSQRLAVRCYLQPLDKNETRDYITARLAACGAPADSVFTNEALDRAYAATGGVPRLINQVCDHALVLGFAGGKAKISGAGIEEAWCDLQQLPLPTAEREFFGAGDPTSTVVEFGDLNDDQEPRTIHAPVQEANSTTTDEPEIAADTSCQLARIEAHLGRLEQEFASGSTSDSYVRFTFPESRPESQELFEHEEVLVDRFGNVPIQLGQLKAIESQVQRSQQLDAKLWPDLTKNQLLQKPKDMTALAMKPHPVSEANVFEIDGDFNANSDQDLILVEEDVQTLPLFTSSLPVRRQEYSQLFAKLRRG